MSEVSAASSVLGSPAPEVNQINAVDLNRDATPFLLLPKVSSMSGYEAANASPSRGYVWFPRLDSRRELTTLSDYEIRKRIKWLYVNFPICRRIIRGTAKIIGIHTPQPATSCDDWNELVFDDFAAHAGSPEYYDLKGRVEFFTNQLLKNELRLRDGRLLGVHTENSLGGAAMIHYEASQIMNPPGTSHGYEQGVSTNRFDKHVGYCVRDGKDPSQFRKIPAKYATYYGHFESYNSIHGISILTSIVCDMMDIVELRGLRKHAAKNAADLGLVIERDSPTLRVASSGPAALAGPLEGVKVQLSDSRTQDLKYEILTQQGVIPHLEDGERIKVVSDDRPTPNNLAFEQALIECCILGAPDLPPDVFYMASGKTRPGPVIRFNLAEVKRFCEINGRRAATEEHPYVVRFVSKRIQKYRESGGRIGIPPHPKGEEWWKKFLYIGQPDMTVDSGRDAMATVHSLESGLTTFSSEYAAKGRYGRRELREKVHEMGWLKREIGRAEEEYEVELTLGEVIPRLGGVGKDDPPIEPRDDDEPVVIQTSNPESES